MFGALLPNIHEDEIRGLGDATRTAVSYASNVKDVSAPHATILVTHSLRTYREALSSWLRGQRPALSVAECEPEALDLARTIYEPCLVICDVPTPAMRRDARTLFWIEVYPAGGRVSLVHLGEDERPTPDISLPEILAVVDRSQPGPRTEVSSA